MDSNRMPYLSKQNQESARGLTLKSSSSVQSEQEDYEKVELIKELVESVRLKQDLERTLTSHQLLNRKGKNKTTRASNLPRQRPADERLSRAVSDSPSISPQRQSTSNKVNQGSSKPRQRFNEPQKVSQQIKRNKSQYQTKLKQFDEYLQLRQTLQEKQNEEIKQELLQLQKEREEKDKEMQEMIELIEKHSLTERNAWFHKYSKSNLKQRKQSTLSIHQENQKIVKRLISIKPHPDMILLSKETQDIQPETKAQGEVNRPGSESFRNTVLSRNEGKQTLMNYSYSGIPREKSSLSFVNYSHLGPINEIPVQRGIFDSTRKDLMSQGGGYTERSFVRKDSNQLQSKQNFNYLNNFEQSNIHSSRPTTTASIISTILHKRPPSTLLKQTRVIRDFQLQASLNKMPEQINDTSHFDVSSSKIQNSLELTGNLQKLNSTHIAIETGINEIEGIEPLELPNRSGTKSSVVVRKSVENFKKLIEERKTKFLPKEVSTVIYSEKPKFLSSQHFEYQKAAASFRESQKQVNLESGRNINLLQRRQSVEKQSKFVKVLPPGYKPTKQINMFSIPNENPQL